MCCPRRGAPRRAGRRLRLQMQRKNCQPRVAGGKAPAQHGRSAAQASTRLAAPIAVRSWLDSNTLHRQPIAQTKDTTVSSKFPASCPAWYFHSWVGASVESDTLGGLKKGPTLLEAPQGGHLRSHLRPENWVRPSGCVQLASHSWLHSLAALKDDTMFL